MARIGKQETKNLKVCLWGSWEREGYAKGMDRFSKSVREGV